MTDCWNRSSLGISPVLWDEVFQRTRPGSGRANAHVSFTKGFGRVEVLRVEVRIPYAKSLHRLVSILRSPSIRHNTAQ